MPLTLTLRPRPSTLVKFLIASALLLLLAMTVISRTHPVLRAVVRMACGTFLLWVVLCGGLMFRYRDAIRRVVQRIPLPWPVTFVLFTLVLALLEEVVTTAMTNLAPVFGVPMGAAYITASTNYLDVVLFHSVIVFFPMFIAWAWVLRRYHFSATATFFLWGFQGLLMEAGFSGPSQFPMFGFWMLIYGPMMWLPAYCIPPRQAREPRIWHYAIPIVASAAALGIFSVAAVLTAKITGFNPFANHPRFHFPPIR